MTPRILTLEPITADAFAPFGDLIEQRDDNAVKMNEARFDRFVELASIDVDGTVADINVSLMRCVIVSELPYQIELLERHPRGSQIFMPVSQQPYVAVVAPPGLRPELADMRAFRVNGDQGINMRRGVWHLPMLGFAKDQRFFVVDRKGGDNCEEHHLDAPIELRGSL